MRRSSRRVSHLIGAALEPAPPPLLPIYNLMAMATAVLVVLIAVAWGVRRFLRARRRST